MVAEPCRLTRAMGKGCRQRVSAVLPEFAAKRPGKRQRAGACQRRQLSGIIDNRGRRGLLLFRKVCFSNRSGGFASLLRV